MNKKLRLKIGREYINLLGRFGSTERALYFIKKKYGSSRSAVYTYVKEYRGK
jgi:hypothetical protein